MTTKKKSAGKKLPATKSSQSFEAVFTELAGKANPARDDTLITMIASGDIELTDVLFFELLKESKDYINKKPFQDKVSQWLLEKNKKMINRIYTVMSDEQRGSDGHINDEFGIQAAYWKNVKLIDDFKKEHPGEYDYKLNDIFKKSYPDLKVDFLTHSTARELAYDLTCDQLNISERSLRQIVKHFHPNASKIIKEIIKKPE